jgi:hypothetical protein
LSFSLLLKAEIITFFESSISIKFYGSNGFSSFALSIIAAQIGVFNLYASSKTSD